MALSMSIAAPWLGAKEKPRRLLPTRSKNRRISGWNRITSTRIPHSTRRFSRKVVAVSRMAEDRPMARIRIIIPRRTRPELVFRSIHSIL